MRTCVVCGAELKGKKPKNQAAHSRCRKLLALRMRVSLAELTLIEYGNRLLFKESESA